VEKEEMRLHPLCVNCFLRQALEACMMATDDLTLQERAFRSALDYAHRADWQVSIPEFGTKIHEIVKLETGNSDPYIEGKREQNDLGQRLYEKLKRQVRSSRDPLYWSAKVAIAGNIIDLAPGRKVDLEKEIQECIERPLDVDRFGSLREKIRENRELLYLADNAGEVFFDKIFMEELVARDIDVTYVVKGGPILNDATIHDARLAGIQNIARVMSNGSRGIGTQLNLCSRAFKSVFDESSLIISKGQGNYESLSENRKRGIFFLLRAKCPVIAENLRVALGTTVLTSSH